MNRLYLLLFFLPFSLHAQFGSLSPAAEISILTIGPGDQLYDKFGHSAFRVKDSLSGVDVVFNYGMYDFNTPNFYLKFAKGNLLYELGVGYYADFFRNYVSENRWIKEQVLNLDKQEKQTISDFLWKNALPENKKYRYDYFYDNCATKIRDVLELSLGDKLVYHEQHIDTVYTFRQLIRKNLQPNSWGSLGIDVALGAVIDREATPIEYQFLPQYVYEGAAHAEIYKEGNAEPLVKKEKVLYKNKPQDDKASFLFSPLFVFGLLGTLILFVTYKDIKRRRRSRYLDAGIFLITGLLGLFLALLWFATDHSAAAFNYNLLWAFPISVFFIVAIARKPMGPLLNKYVSLLLVLMALLFLHWITGVQSFSIGLLPFLIALAFRYMAIKRLARRESSEQ